jgi:hypothetical protein
MALATGRKKERSGNKSEKKKINRSKVKPRKLK